METIEPILNLIAAVWERVTTAPLHLLLVVVLNVLGILIKRVPAIPNRTIPLILIAAGAVGYPLLASPGTVTHEVRHPAVVLGLFGFLLGFGAWILHLVLLKRAEKYLPEWIRAELLILAPLLLACAFAGTGCVELRSEHRSLAIGILPKPPTNAVIGISYTKIGIIVGQNPATQTPEVTIGYQRGAYHRVPVNTNGPSAVLDSGVTTRQDGLDTTIEEHFRVTPP